MENKKNLKKTNKSTDDTINKTSKKPAVKAKVASTTKKASTSKNVVNSSGKKTASTTKKSTTTNATKKNVTAKKVAPTKKAKTVAATSSKKVTAKKSVNATKKVVTPTNKNVVKTTKNAKKQGVKAEQKSVKNVNTKDVIFIEKELTKENVLKTIEQTIEAGNQKLKRVVLISDINSKIGFHAAKSLAQKGHIVYGYAKYKKRKNKKLQKNGVTPIVWGVKNKIDLHTSFKGILEKEKKVDLLINNGDHEEFEKSWELFKQKDK